MRSKYIANEMTKLFVFMTQQSNICNIFSQSSISYVDRSRGHSTKIQTEDQRLTMFPPVRSFEVNNESLMELCFKFLHNNNNNVILFE